MNRMFFLILIGVSLAASAAASDDDRYSAGTAAATGASTQVLASTALDYATGSSGASDSPAQTILKRALVGATTGATATAMSYEPKTNIQPKNVPGDEVAAAAASTEPYSRVKNKKWKKGHRPPGWDKGKKTGWGDSDVPPGLAKKRS